MLAELKDGLAEHGIAMDYDEQVLDYLTEKSYSVQYGARNLRRTIEKDIENPVAEKIIDSYLEPIRILHVQVEDGKIALLAK
jgi:ATP-dependent Clp protease ATP-binding subunit ClpA